jgi:hypothetical protein
VLRDPPPVYGRLEGHDPPDTRNEEHPMAGLPEFEEHEHDALVHDHEHWHVTHNHRAMTGGFEHLSWHHAHEHDHPAVTHAHVPHENFEAEHADEAHDHDHGEPVRKRAAKKTAKKGTKKATERSAG